VKKQWPYFLLAFVIPVATILWWWGMFASVSVEVAERGPYRYAYLNAQGYYSRLAAKQQEVRAELAHQGITAGGQVTLLLKDPRTTPHDQLWARTGYLIGPEARPQAPLAEATIPVRQVAVARIKAHPLFAYGKTYSALLKFTKQQQTTLHLPTLEIYDASILSVEMPLNETTSSSVPP
jgi:hypothetical protein